jgi:hypothetical protein
MIPKDYVYTDIDGCHWPDTKLGSSMFYSIEYSQWLSDENDSFVSASWEIPEGVTGSEAYESGGEAFIKITADTRGSHKIKMNLTTSESGYVQTQVVEMILKVY